MSGGRARTLRSLASRPGRAAWAILAVALVLRLALIAATPHFEPGADAADYDRHAASIAAGDGYPDTQLAGGGGPSAFRPPAYPYFLGAVYAVSGNSWTAGRIAQALLGTVVVALIGVLAWQLWGRRAALASMGVAAVAPPLLVLGASLLSEPLFLVFELGAIACAVAHRRSPHDVRWALATGALAGLATLTRTNGVLLIAALVIAVWTATPRLSRAALAQPAALLAVAVLVMAPWTIRNAVELHAFIPLTTQGDYALSRIYNDPARTDPDHPSQPHNPPGSDALFRDPSLDEVEVASRLGADARAYMRHHPVYVAETVARNAFRALHLDGTQLGELAASALGITRWLADAGIFGFYVLGLLALAALALVPDARRMPWFVWAGPLLALAPALLISAGRTRYRAPIDPLIVMLAALALLAAWDRWGPGRGRVIPTR